LKKEGKKKIPSNPPLQRREKEEARKRKGQKRELVRWVSYYQFWNLNYQYQKNKIKCQKEL